MTRGERADAVADKKPRASTRGAPPPRERRYSSDSAAVLLTLATARSCSAHTTLSQPEPLASMQVTYKKLKPQWIHANFAARRARL